MRTKLNLVSTDRARGANGILIALGKNAGCVYADTLIDPGDYLVLDPETLSELHKYSIHRGLQRPMEEVIRPRELRNLIAELIRLRPEITDTEIIQSCMRIGGGNLSPMSVQSALKSVRNPEE